MPISTNLINIAKGLEHSSFLRSKTQKALRTQAFTEIKQRLEQIKLDGFQKIDGYESLHTAATDAKRELDNVHPPMAPDIFEAATQKHKDAVEALTKFETDHAEQAGQDRSLVALSRLKIKSGFGFNPTGNEYARIKSTPQLGEKHPVIRTKLPSRGVQSAAEYVTKSHDTTQKLNEALETRTPFVSPRFAVRGKDIAASTTRYNEATSAFQHTFAADGVTPVAQDLAQKSVPVKILQNGKFRIQVKDMPKVGKLTYKTSLGEKSVDEHITTGLEKAVKLYNAIEKDATEGLISHKLLRNNFVQKQVDFKAVDHFTEAKKAFSEELAKTDNRIQALKAKNISVKVLRDGAFRIQRLNSEGTIAQTVTLPFVKKEGMATHVEKGLAQAVTLSGQDLPEKISTKQKMSNKFRPFKKAVLNFFN